MAETLEKEIELSEDFKPYESRYPLRWGWAAMFVIGLGLQCVGSIAAVKHCEYMRRNPCPITTNYPDAALDWTMQMSSPLRSLFPEVNELSQKYEDSHRFE